jgi:hypothetical protein
VATLDLLRLERVWSTLSAGDRQQLFDDWPDVYGAIELWVRARQ